MSAANPVPERRSTDLPVRAENELAALLATSDRVAGPDRSPRRPAFTARKRMAVAAGFAVVVALGGVGWAVNRDTAPPPSTAAEPFYQNTAALEGSADIIVRAQINATRPEKRDGIAETVATAKVSASAKGTVEPGKDIEFAYTTPGSAAAAPTGLKVGTDYVLLLESRANAPAFVVNAFQSYYAVQGGRLVPAADNPVTLSPEVKKQLGVH